MAMAALEERSQLEDYPEKAMLIRLSHKKNQQQRPFRNLHDSARSIKEMRSEEKKGKCRKETKQEDEAGNLEEVKEKYGKEKNLIAHRKPKFVLTCDIRTDKYKVSFQSDNCGIRKV